jgi:hypothetical protein
MKSLVLVSFSKRRRTNPNISQIMKKSITYIYILYSMLTTIAATAYMLPQFIPYSDFYNPILLKEAR